jgi:hypothetical protein
MSGAVSGGFGRVGKHDCAAAVKPGTPGNRGRIKLDPRDAPLADSPLEQHRTGARCRRPTPPTPASSPEAAPRPAGLENFPEPAKLVTETAGVKAELRQQIGVLTIVGVYLIRELLAGLLSLVVVALALQQLHNLVFADVHELSSPSNW